MTAVNPIPEGYPRVIPYLSVDGAASAIEFYGKVFGATERMRMNAPTGKIGHAELEFGDSVVMLADTFPDMGGKVPEGDRRHARHRDGLRRGCRRVLPARAR